MSIRLKCSAIYLNNKEMFSVLNNPNNSSKKDLYTQQSNS